MKRLLLSILLFFSIVGSSQAVTVSNIILSGDATGVIVDGSFIIIVGEDTYANIIAKVDPDVNDMWIATDTTVDADAGDGIVYGGTWLNVGPIQGPKGDAGATGSAGATGAAGADGTDGTDGDSAYAYIAYASDDSGTDFTTTFSAALDYIAILSTDTEIPSPAVGDFAGLWKNYKGAAGQDGSGLTDGDKGDVTVSSTGTVFTVTSVTGEATANPSILLNSASGLDWWMRADDGDSTLEFGFGTIAGTDPVSRFTENGELELDYSFGTVPVASSITSVRPIFTITFDPTYVYAQESTNNIVPLGYIGADFPNGAICTGWTLSYNIDPTTELNADLKRATAMIGLGSAAVMDTLDTASGFSSEDTIANINSGSAIALDSFVYIQLDADPTDENVLVTFQLWGYAPGN